MTTIAYRNGVLAADTQTTAGNLRDGVMKKIAKRGQYLAAEAGSAALGSAFLDWFRGGMRGEAPELERGDQSATGVIFLPDGQMLIRNRTGWERRTADMWCMGSGGDIALGAMAAGATPEEAVRVAMQHDIYTGGEVEVLRRDTA